MKQEKKKSSYSFLNNMKYIFTNMWKWQKSGMIFAFLCSPLQVLTPFLGIYLSMAVVGAVTENRPAEEVLAAILLISVIITIASIARIFFSTQVEKSMHVHDVQYSTEILDKVLRCDYENVESADGLTRLSKAFENVGMDQSGARQITNLFSAIPANIIGVVSYSIILFYLSPLIMLTVTMLSLTGVFTIKMTAAWNYRNKDRWKAADRKLKYLRENSGDFTRAKDMRLYGMTDWFKNVFANTLSDRMVWHKKEQRYSFGVSCIRGIRSFILEIIAFGYLVYLIVTQGLSAADFVLFFGVIGGLTRWTQGILGDFDRLFKIHFGFSELREFLEYPDKSNKAKGIPVPEDTFSIEFRNVSYRYPKNTEDTIKNLSFTIHKGEKLAIVGLNGAGKTTLVKLMCGLYTPVSGEILINNHPVNAYNREEFYSLFAAVFQEIFVLPLSIARNVSAKVEDEIDRDKVSAALEFAGLSSKIAGLPDGIDTKLVKSVHEGAVDLSGGEMQKLALARALYKGGKALILDEPTAALDPIAENSIYMEYNRMTAGHTSVFISHRLASTRFCDRILYMEDGRIIEEGTHDELIKSNGKYAYLFDVQSHYYQENINEEKEGA